MTNNTITITGRMTDKAIIREKDGKKVSSFTVAVKGFGDHTDFIRCTGFSKKVAEYLEANTDKGAKVTVSGSLHIGSYTNKDGVKVNTAEVYARNIELATAEVSEPEQAPEEE